jgi:hypothetical protein
LEIFKEIVWRFCLEKQGEKDYNVDEKDRKLLAKSKTAVL